MWPVSDGAGICARLPKDRGGTWGRGPGVTGQSPQLAGEDPGVSRTRVWPKVTQLVVAGKADFLLPAGRQAGPALREGMGSMVAVREGVTPNALLCVSKAGPQLTVPPEDSAPLVSQRLSPRPMGHSPAFSACFCHR